MLASVPANLTNYTYWLPRKCFSSLAGAKNVPAVLADMGSCSCMVVTYNLLIRISTTTTLALPDSSGVHMWVMSYVNNGASARAKILCPYFSYFSPNRIQETRIWYHSKHLSLHYNCMIKTWGWSFSFKKNVTFKVT